MGNSNKKYCTLGSIRFCSAIALGFLKANCRSLQGGMLFIPQPCCEDCIFQSVGLTELPNSRLHVYILTTPQSQVKLQKQTHTCLAPPKISLAPKCSGYCKKENQQHREGDTFHTQLLHQLEVTTEPFAEALFLHPLPSLTSAPQAWSLRGGDRQYSLL